MSTSTPTPPDTVKREVTETLHGDDITDPYRWLEEESDRVEEWIERQNEYADVFLRNSDNRERLRPRFEELARTVEYSTVVGEKNGYFQRIREVEEDHSVLYFFEELGGERRELVDPNTFSDDGSVSMDWWEASKDGSLIAYGIAEGGDEQYDIKIMDVGSREIVDEVPDAGRTGPMSLAWDGDGFYYVRTGSIGDGGQLNKRIMYHEHH
ncbi:MAG: S9 family peptidase, partial [Halobacteria archaeon]|nr:S9 family peptidase [Halobacteria archaeon]